MPNDRSSTEPNVLLVPMHLDALCLPIAKNVREALADYTKMPFNYKKEDGTYAHSNRHANISEHVLSQAFSSTFHELLPGIHLHWALPDALTRSVESDREGRHRFPIVPRRWLVSRTRNGAVDQQWVVESDFLYPDLTGLLPPHERPAAVTVPFPRTNLRHGPYQPFRHMGRAVPLADWQPTPSSSAEYLRQFDLALTAMGPLEWHESLDHVKASFAAFYPGCFSVFGFHDPDPALGADPTGVRYDVIGWDNQPEGDILRPFYDQHQGKPDRVQVREDFERRFRWQVDLGAAALPRRSVCYARLTFSGPIRANRATTAKAVSIAIGSTGTEALSAYLAHHMADDAADKTVIEQQLDALEFTDQLEQQQLDVGEKFQEARHARGFNGLSGGLLWSVQRAESAGEPAGKELTLPADVAHLLSALNQLQAAYDRANDATASMSARLFNDWHKFIYATHPQDVEDQMGDEHPTDAEDLTDALWAHHESGVVALRKHLFETGKLGWSQNRRSRAVAGQPETLRFSVLDVNTTAHYLNFWDELDNNDLTDDYWGWELATYGITLSSAARAEVVQQGGEDREGREWRIVDGARTYKVNVEDGVMNLHLPPSEDQLAARLLRAIEALQQRITDLTPACVLKAVPGPRYWQPNDPVVLMVGEAIQPGLRHGRDGRLRKDGLLECQLLEGVADERLNRLPLDSTLLAQIRQRINGVQSRAAGAERVGFTASSQEPWNPFLLEWDVQFFPHPADEVDDKGVEKYLPDHLTRRYTLASEAVDLTHNNPDNVGDFVSNAEPYRGLSILSPHASGTMKQRIASYVAKQRLLLPEPHKGALYGLTGPALDEYLDAQAQAILAGYQPDPEKEYDDTLHTALAAYVEIQARPTLSQALGGFNDALLMQKRTVQLGIEDPIGFDDHRFFATQVAGTARSALLLASTPMRDFNPIRSGELRVTSLCLVDSFGQTNVVKTNPAEGATVVSAELMPLRVRGLDDHRVVLTPRLAQPARILFRWLSAAPLQGEGEGDEQPEMNDHPATTPICGWLVPNNLDGGLMVFNTAGQPLGVINAVGFWDPVPGAAHGVGVEAIDNPYLRKVVEHLTAAGRAGQEYTKAFGAVLNSALDQSDPEALGHSPALSLLIGRPLAVVRAAVHLELKGLPARDKHWRVFNETFREYQESDEEYVTPISESPARWTAGFDKVALPIRIGEFRQFNDGLLGYWKEQADGSFEGSTFYAPQSGRPGFGGADPASRKIVTVTAETGPVNILQSVSAQSQVLTMLVDPRGVVHATSSVVPAKAISIPPEQYAKALEALEVTFVSAPLLTGRAGYGRAGEGREIRAAVPEQPGFAWSWLSRQRGVWEETRTFTALDPSARMSGPQQICEGWLKLSRDTSPGSNDDHGS